jgi:hypothetical protein
MDTASNQSDSSYGQSRDIKSNASSSSYSTITSSLGGIDWQNLQKTQSQERKREFNEIIDKAMQASDNSFQKARIETEENKKKLANLYYKKIVIAGIALASGALITTQGPRIFGEYKQPTTTDNNNATNFNNIAWIIPTALNLANLASGMYFVNYYNKKVYKEKENFWRTQSKQLQKETKETINQIEDDTNELIDNAHTFLVAKILLEHQQKNREPKKHVDSNSTKEGTRRSELEIRTLTKQQGVRNINREEEPDNIEETFESSSVGEGSSSSKSSGKKVLQPLLRPQNGRQNSVLSDLTDDRSGTSGHSGKKKSTFPSISKSFHKLFFSQSTEKFSQSTEK